MSTFFPRLIPTELTFKEWGFAVLVVFIFVRIYQNSLILSHETGPQLATPVHHLPHPHHHLPASPLPLPRSRPLGPHPHPLPRLPLARTPCTRRTHPLPKIQPHRAYRPDELSFADPRAWHDIYSNQPSTPAFPKINLWHGVKAGRPMSVLNALEPATHRRFRRAMERAFTERAVGSQEVIMRGYVDSLITHLRDLGEGNADVVVDIVRWYGCFTFDLIGDLGFGESLQCLESEEYHPWVSMMFDSLRAATYAASLWYYPGVSWILGYFVPRSVVRKQMEHWNLAVEKINRRLEREISRPDIISLIKHDEGKEGLTIQELQATASVIIVAGSETTVSVLSGITNYLVNNPLKLAFLTAEIREKFEKEEEISIATLKETSYLNAVIQEGLRLCKPTPVGLPRVVPPGGGRVCGHDLPEDIFVNVHPLSISLSSEYFHRPSEFHPERWLAANDSSSPFYNDNRNAVQVFGVGPRSCIGRPLAMAELQLVLARMVWRFELEKVDSEAGNLKWKEQRVFTVVERKPFEVRLRTRSALR